MKRQPVRVAMIIQSYLPRVGGAERQLDALVPLLRQQNVEVRIFTRRYPGMAPSAVINGAPVHRTVTAGHRLRPALLGKAVDTLLYSTLTLNHLRRWTPDLVHAHELLSPATTALAAHHLWGLPVVAKVLRGGRLGDIDKLRSRAGGRRRLRALRRHVAAFIAISREIDEELASAGVPEGRRVFVPNGVDTDQFAPPSPVERAQARAALGLDGGPVAVYTGRLVPEKQVDLLLAVWREIHATYPDARLLVAGDGPEFSRLQNLAGPGIRFAGRVDDVVPYLHAGDLFVLPSATEGLSNALLEAMAAGLAPVATAVGGAPDLIMQGESGLLVPSGDRQALAGALCALLADPARRDRLGRTARRRIEDDYSLPSVATRLRALYDRVLATSTRSGHHA